MQTVLRVPFLDLRSQHLETSDLVEPAIREIFASGVFVLGEHNRELEREIAALHAVSHAIAVNSGTDALRIAMQAAGIGPGDEVITVAFTFVSSVETIVQLGATPVFVDIDPATFNLDPALLEAAITERTKAILPIHLFGQLADMETITAIARRHGLLVVEDAAQAIAASRHGKFPGQFGIAAALSFYVTKNLGAPGDGGMILTNFDAIAERARSLRVHGMSRERYYYEDIGYASRLSEIGAAVLRSKLTRLADWNERRRAIAQRYSEGLRDLPVALPTTLEGNVHIWHQFTIRTPRRDALRSHLAQAGIDSMVYYPVPLHFHEPYRRFGGGEGSLPETERAAREVLSLPIHPSLTDEQIDHVVGTIRAFFESND